MDYLSYLEEEFSSYTVSSEFNINNTEDTIIVFKKLGGGANFANSIYQPIQIIAHTTDVNTLYTALASFAEEKSNTYFKQDNEYVKQTFSTPVVLTTAQAQSANVKTEIYLNGTLLVTEDEISDIIKVEIDGYEVETVTRKLIYNGVQDSVGLNDGKLNNTNINAGLIQFQMSTINNNNEIGVKVRRIRQNTLALNTTFTVKLTFSDNDYEETYTMKLLDYVVDMTNEGIPAISYTFVR